jgi:hypothetical protein
MDGLFMELLFWITGNYICGQKKSCVTTGKFRWVDDGARTHDPQNHNLML